MKRIVMLLFMAGAVFAEAEIPARDRLRQMVYFHSLDDHGSMPASIFLGFAKENGIPQSEVYKAVEELARRFLSELQTTSDAETRFSRTYGLHTLLSFMGKTQDTAWLPFMDEVYAAMTNTIVRHNVIRAKIDIQKAESIEFAERAIQNGEIEERQLGRIWEKMGEQYARVNDKDKKKISAFLLRQMEKETGTSNQKKLEDILAANSAEYRTSKQRKKYAERFLNSGHVFARDLGKVMMKEIEKVPSEKRADLSELLRKPVDETKGE